MPEWDTPPPSWADSDGFTEDNYRCVACIGHRVEAEKKRRAHEYAAWNRCRLEETRRALLERVPSEFRGLRLATIAAAGRLRRPEASKELEPFILWPDELPPVLLLVGPTEAGKTSAAAALLNEIVERGTAEGAKRREAELAGGIRFLLSSRLASARSRSPLGEDPEEVVQALEATVLVIDELGLEEQRFIPELETIIHEWHSSGRRTIVTTGLTSEVLKERYQGGIVRRLAMDRAHSTTVIRCASAKEPTC
jgi:DNA replication protein DnaC